MPTDNMSVIRSAVDAFNTGQAEGFQKAFGGELAHRAAESLKTLRGAFPDLHYTIDHIQAEGNHVTFAYSVKGTHKGALGDFKATNKTAAWQGTGVATIEQGVITSVNTTEDWVRAGIQLGIVNPTMTGTWTGSSGTTTVTLVLTQAGTSVSGTATMSGVSTKFNVAGTNNFPSVNLQGTAYGLQVTFTGAFNGANSVPGTLTVQGFPAQAITITRQAAHA